MTDLINALEDFIEKKIATERDDINNGYVTQTHLDISRNELRAALDARGLEIRSKNDD
jgi:hypothetical protein